MTRSFAANGRSRWKELFSEYRFLPMILLLSLVLNLWGNRWGTPNSWHPDEIIRRSIGMVKRRTVNPHHFAYGGLHYYVQAVGAIMPTLVYAEIFDPKPPQSDTQARNLWTDRQRARMIQTARAISALMSTLVVGITFMIGTILFDKRTGYLAALFLAVSMSFVAIAHFATVDSPANFWYWLSCLFALLLWKRREQRWYFLAAITAGFAIGTKVDHLVIILPLLVSHLLRWEGFVLRRLSPFAILIPLSFVLANPALITAPFEFLDGFTRDLSFNFLLDKARPTPLTSILGYANSGLGPPLFAAALAGFAYGLYDLALAKHLPGRIVWLLGTFVPYVLVYLSKPRINVWYIPLLFPPLTILAAYVCIAAASALSRHYALVIRSLIAGIAVYSFLHAVALILQFSNDSRYQAAHWIKQHVPARATILMFNLQSGPVIPQEKYHIIVSPPDRDTRLSISGRENLIRDRTYQRLREAILTIEQWAGRWSGLPVREQPYRAWFDHVFALYENPSDGPPGISAVETRNPDYVILHDDTHRKALAALKAPKSGYRLIAEFQFINRFGMQPSFSFVNPRVYIFQREAGQSLPPPGLQGNIVGELNPSSAYWPMALDTCAKVA